MKTVGAFACISLALLMGWFAYDMIQIALLYNRLMGWMMAGSCVVLTFILLYAAWMLLTDEDIGE